MSAESPCSASLVLAVHGAQMEKKGLKQVDRGS